MKKLCKYNIKVLFALVNISPFEYQNILCEAMNMYIFTQIHYWHTYRMQATALLFQLKWISLDLCGP